MRKKYYIKDCDEDMLEVEFDNGRLLIAVSDNEEGSSNIVAFTKEELENHIKVFEKIVRFIKDGN